MLNIYDKENWKRKMKECSSIKKKRKNNRYTDENEKYNRKYSLAFFRMDKKRKIVENWDRMLGIKAISKGYFSSAGCNPTFRVFRSYWIDSYFFPFRSITCQRSLQCSNFFVVNILRLLYERDIIYFIELS